jgi:hypothetical protein
MLFNLAQTFYVDPSPFKGASEVGISKIDLYFRFKPPFRNNASGIDAPGVEIRIVPCINGVPAIDAIGTVRPTEPTEHGAKFAFYSTGKPARVEWGQIQASRDGSSPTSFFFEVPYFVKTNQEYAILIKYDGSEQFRLAVAKSGEKIIGSQNKFSTAEKGVGNLYEYINGTRFPFFVENPEFSTQGSTQLNTANNVATADESAFFLANWAPLKDTDLKFKVYFARYFYNGIPAFANSALYDSPLITNSDDRGSVSIPVIYNSNNGTYSVIAQAEKMEYIAFEDTVSSYGNLYFGELVYQEQPFFPGAGANNNTGGSNAVLTISVSNTGTPETITANADYRFANGITFNNAGGFNSLYNLQQDEYIVVVSNNDIAVRKIVEIVSNTVIRVDLPVPFSNTAAYFYKSPVGKLKSVGRSFLRNRSTSLMTLYDSNANNSTRFVNNTILFANVVNSGTGYNNTDFITVTGYENVAGKVVGGYPATANIITNGSGSITELMFTNTGAGFINTSVIITTISNSTGGTSTGSNANISYISGATLRTTFTTNNYFGNCVIENIETHRVKTEITVNNPVGSVFDMNFSTLFYSVSDNTVFGKTAYYINNPLNTSNTSVKIFKSHTLNVTNTAVFPSRSNEFIIPFANGSLANTSVIGEDFSNSSVISFTLSSNNDYIAPFIDPEIIRTHFSKYIINNNYTYEETNWGNAYSKHITTKVNFGTGRFAEDMLVYLTAYRPSGTDVKVYARIHNSNDPEAFDDKDWSLLELIDGIDVFSSKDNDSDYKEYTYNFVQFPNTEITLEGTATITKGQNYIIGSGTSFGNNLTGANTTFNSNTNINATANFIRLSFQPFSNGEQLTYYSAANKTALSGLSNNNIYFVVNATSNTVQLSNSKNGSPINIALTNTNATFNSQSDINDADDFITISSNPFVNNDIVVYLVDAGNTAITGLANNVSYYVVQANSTGVKLSTSEDGSVIDISNNNISETGHNFYTGSGHSLYRTAVVENDLIKIYDPLFPNNYVIQVVNNVVNSSYLFVKRSLGDLSANLAGTISVNTTHTTFDGVGTTFTSDFVTGDLIAVWSNSSVYEVRTVSSITDANTIVVDSSFTFTNAAANYAIVTQGDYETDSLTPNGLKIDRLIFKNQAFNYKPNENVVRYYNSGMVQFDTYDTYQIKIVLLSNSDIIIPKVDDVRAIGVSA